MFFSKVLEISIYNLILPFNCSGDVCLFFLPWALNIQFFRWEWYYGEVADLLCKWHKSYNDVWDAEVVA